MFFFFNILHFNSAINCMQMSQYDIGIMTMVKWSKYHFKNINNKKSTLTICQLLYGILIYEYISLATGPLRKCDFITQNSDCVFSNPNRMQCVMNLHFFCRFHRSTKDQFIKARALLMAVNRPNLIWMVLLLYCSQRTSDTLSTMTFYKQRHLMESHTDQKNI